MTEIRTEVCIIGGGPAGSAAAIRLAALGHAVCVVERHAPPRRRVGESITPGIWAQLELLGLRKRVEGAGFLLAHEADVRWAEAHAQRVAERGPGLLVDRARFDALLLEAAAERGARIVAPASARRAERDSDGWRVEVTAGGGPVTIAARFVVDASGRRGFLPGARRPSAPRTLALYGYWRGDGLPARTQVEAGPDAWYWGAPLPDGSFNAMVFVDPGAPRIEGRARLEAAYRDLLARSELLAGCVRACLVDGVHACDATAHADAHPIGDGWIKLGDTGLALDPLSSTGVEQAVQSALVGSIAVHTMLARPANAGLAEQLYRDRQTEAAARHAAWAAGHYAEVHRHVERPFWRGRATAARPLSAEPEAPGAAPERTGAAPELAGAPPELAGTHDMAPELLRDPLRRVALSPRAAFATVPCLDGDFVEARRALHHPGLARPVVFVDEVPLAPLLEPLRAGTPLLALMRALSAQVPLPRALRIAGWLCRHDVLVAA
jgi:flavin-dependent dehydrogenase